MWGEKKEAEKDLYKLLGVDSAASPRDIKKAFQKRSLIAHPDKGGSTEEMAALNEAYEVLKDPQKRKKFDYEWEAFHVADDEVIAPIAGYLQTKAVPFSFSFKQQHAEWTSKYSSNALSINASLLENRFNRTRSCIVGAL
ncbi:MAG: DnaJ domain-containing protein [Pseudomonadota bacterium]|nr:DnaJ domain-containing protein [Gammaproteobacteria bacterium]MBU1558245.1 DnaJ domain-containing protein [Gammaproteobacteria bacterium]MBU2545732.1 DnaJ domain-containing protein [Gammaproteobacteria bacterium]